VTVEMWCCIEVSRESLCVLNIKYSIEMQIKEELSNQKLRYSFATKG
jgi:hypothetical protein